MHYFKIFSISRLIKSEGNLFFKFNGENNMKTHVIVVILMVSLHYFFRTNNN